MDEGCIDTDVFLRTIYFRKCVVKINDQWPNFIKFDLWREQGIIVEVYKAHHFIADPGHIWWNRLAFIKWDLWTNKPAVFC